MKIPVRTLDVGVGVGSSGTRGSVVARREAEHGRSRRRRPAIAAWSNRSRRSSTPTTASATQYVKPQIHQILGVTPRRVPGPRHVARMVTPRIGRPSRRRAGLLAGEGGELNDYRMVRPRQSCRSATAPSRTATTPAGSLWEQGILFDVTELKEAEARVAHMAFHDGLTGLANRQLFEETLEHRARAGQTRPGGRGGALPRPRQLQGGQRHPRAPRRRPAPDRARRPADACTRGTTWSLGRAATSS